MSQGRAVAALSHRELAAIAPNYTAMRTAIAQCEKVDEIAKLSNQATAAQAYYRQTLDVENEMQASRIRVRAERRLGELLKRMADKGERRKATDNQHRASSTTRLADLGIPKDRASRAMQLAAVPEEEFERAMEEPKVAQPRRILEERKPPKPQPLVSIDKSLALWGKVRDLGQALESDDLPPIKHWRENLQPFQVEHLRQHIPKILDYLNAINRELKQ